MSTLSQFNPYIEKKYVQKFTLTLGTYVDGVAYWTLGSAKIIDSVSSTDGSAYLFSPNGPAARFCFINLGKAVNPNKTYVVSSYAGHQGNPNEKIMCRLYNWNNGSQTAGFPSKNDTVAYQIQLAQRGLWPKSSFGTIEPEITVEVIEYI